MIEDSPRKENEMSTEQNAVDTKRCDSILKRDMGWRGPMWRRGLEALALGAGSEHPLGVPHEPFLSIHRR